MQEAPAPESLREEEEESASDPESVTERDHDQVLENKTTFSSNKITLEQQQQVKELLNDLRNGKRPNDDSEETPIDVALNSINYENFPALRRACAKLSVKARDHKLNVTFRACITAMVGTLNIYLDPELSYTWREASLLVVKARGHGQY